jgi:phospholipase C
MSLRGYIQLQMERTRSHWFMATARACVTWADAAAQRCSASSSSAGKHPITGIICQVGLGIVKYVGLLFINLVNILWLLISQIFGGIVNLLFPHTRKRHRINHIFVIMLENRAFDHMLGLSGIKGTDAVTGQPTALEGIDGNSHWNLDLHGNKIFPSTPADWAMPFDPGHEFTDVKTQLCGSGGNYPKVNNSGFVINYSGVDPQHPAEIMKCYAPNQLPVVTTLAQEFGLCDHWFSSMPGPTWPNRFFIHAASSGGLDHSPQKLDVASSILFNGYSFQHGTIYDRLDEDELGWTIYKGDEFPQSLAINGMNVRLLEGKFKDFEDFSRDVNNPNFSTSYVFLEPNYGHAMTNFTCGNSQHPIDDVTRGERLLKTIYETIRNSPHWNDSLLIITYDEHGGFYDHVPPPQTVSPGDATTDPENNLFHFDFTQLGVRVPAVIISPLIPKNLIDHTVYDHTSALATTESILGLRPLTNRDRQAKTLEHLFSLKTPRTDAPTTLPEPAVSGIHCPDDAEAGGDFAPIEEDIAKDMVPVDSTLQGFLHIAFLRDMQSSLPGEKEQRKIRYQSISNRHEARQYMNEVRQRVEPRA